MCTELPRMWYAKTCMFIFPAILHELGFSSAAMLAQLSPAMHTILYCHQVLLRPSLKHEIACVLEVTSILSQQQANHIMG